MALSKVDVESGGTGLVAAGASGNVLTSDGTDWTSAAAAGGGAWSIIGTAVASGSTGVTITGLSSTYDSYMCIMSDMKLGSNSAQFYVRVGDASGIDTGASDYSWTDTSQSTSNSAPAGNMNQYTAKIRAGDIDCNNATNYSFSGHFYIYNPSDTSNRTLITGEVVTTNTAGHLECASFSGLRRDVIAIDRVEVSCSFGNIASGRFTVWGIAHA